ncbi:hypothetical protein BC628DRAFT_1125276 [Trametes gibbosa]|nr:hypothetical protein BC628DRAFT_1125276 [Trametes gibbosa]
MRRGRVKVRGLNLQLWYKRIYPSTSTRFCFMGSASHSTMSTRRYLVISTAEDCLFARGLLFSAGWVHRDIRVSAMNFLLWCDDFRLPADLEYADIFDLDVASDHRTDPNRAPLSLWLLKIQKQRLIYAPPDTDVAHLSFRNTHRPMRWLATIKIPQPSLFVIDCNYRPRDLGSMFWVLLWICVMRPSHPASSSSSQPGNNGNQTATTSFPSITRRR